MAQTKIGIKLADSSFYPILTKDEPAKKMLEVTTVRDNQTTVQINLYETDNDSLQNAVYVDTLLVANLVPHEKGYPTVRVLLNLDDDNVLTAEAVDSESGESSNISVSLITLGKDQLMDDLDFEVMNSPMTSADTDTYTDDDEDYLNDLDSFLTEGQKDFGVQDSYSDKSDDSFDDSSFTETDDFLSASQKFDSGSFSSKTEAPVKPGDYSNAINDFGYLHSRASIEEKKMPLVALICIICAAVSLVVLILMMIFYFSTPKFELLPDSEDINPSNAITGEQQLENDRITIVEDSVVIPTKPSVELNEMEDIAYKIKWGDTLWDISNAYYKNPWLYKKIAVANAIRDPDYILAGTWIAIPSK